MNPLLSFFRRKILRIPADRWDYQYERGEWDGLAEESARLEAVIRMIGAKYRRPDILEIGCGEALMLQRLQAGSYRTFTGIDISRVAISKAKRLESERVRFVHADMDAFSPQVQYDVIAFNESLYYANDPMAVFARYLPYLNKGGSIVVTAFDNKYTSHLWPSLERRWQPENSEKVRSGDLVWNVRMYQPDKKF